MARRRAALRLLLALAAALLVLLGRARAEYSEELTLRPLPGAHKAAAHFHFAVREPFDASAALFPSALAQIMDAYDAKTLHLSFALGRYSHALYGREVAANAPFGTRLQVDLRVGDEHSETESNATAADVRRRWRGITSELGGVFSASLNQMDATVVVGLLDDETQRQHLGAYPTSSSNATDASSSLLFLHGSLAREELCTENLTPWLKMLPCRSAAGLGRLVDPVKFLLGEYLSLTLFASRSLSAREWTLHQHLTVVQHVEKTVLDKSSKRKVDASPSLSDLFLDEAASDELSACPLAAASVLIVDDAHVSEGVQVTDLRQQPVSTSAPLFSTWTQPLAQVKTENKDVVEVHRFATGYGQVRGGMAVRLTNHHARSAVRVQYHDVVPWFLRVYFSTFRVVGSAGSEQAVELDKLAFEPAELRGRPNQFHVELVLPARSSAVLSVQFEKAFLRLSEHPPDANRGFDLAPGVAVFSLLDEPAEATTLFTEPLLVPLPTPDFSMPYNVITMTSTVVAFFVGSMLNSLLRKAPRIQQLMARPKAE